MPTYQPSFAIVQKAGENVIGLTLVKVCLYLSADEALATESSLDLILQLGELKLLTFQVSCK